ncbi:recombinase RecT [Acinetobacter thermotolerans]|uniref:recombinase RecT n=1 Tax=Acinetobacter thermotolerans TaxID=3151487 RepID=UPI00325AEE70
MNSIVKTGQNTAVNFLTPNNLQEAMQIAEILASSDIVPKDYQRKPGNILVAMQWGAEIGLQPLQAMQNIAVINGRPSIWGDAMLALVRGSGLLESIKEEITPDGLKAICTVKRKGEEPAVSEFSMEDAKRAGLSGKQGPWTQYPKRMMKLRARSYALRDVFPDVLKGMAIAEEEQDKEIDITPAGAPRTETKPNTGASALKSRLKKKNDAVDSSAKELDLSVYYINIKDARTLNQLEKVGEEIAALNLGEPAKSEIGEVFKEKRRQLKEQVKLLVQSIIDQINDASDMNALNQIMENEFEPASGEMTDEQIAQINSAYEAQEAALTP